MGMRRLSIVFSAPLHYDIQETEKGFRYAVSKTFAFDGADERTRTADLLITNQLLYQLSYVGPVGGLRTGARG